MPDLTIVSTSLAPTAYSPHMQSVVDYILTFELGLSAMASSVAQLIQHFIVMAI